MTTPGKTSTKNLLINAGGLKDRNWQRFLSGPDQSLLEELYVPALKCAVSYDRCCAYFSSSVLSAAARGFGKLIERLLAMGKSAPKPAVRLMVNEELSPEDVHALMEEHDLQILEQMLQKRFKTPTEGLEQERLAMLAWLFKQGYLDIRIGVMRSGQGILHAKFGIVTDSKKDSLVFFGSSNESAQGLLANYEMLEVSSSWQDAERLLRYQKEFESLWLGNHPAIFTVNLPDALRLKLIKLAPKEAPVQETIDLRERQKAAMIWRYLAEAPYSDQGGATCDATALVQLWPHQKQVVQETSSAWPTGRLLCDEVGMGKTIEAILILRRLLAGRGVQRVLILLPAGLLKQWQAELREKGGLIFPRLEGGNQLVWPDERVDKVANMAAALEQDCLLMSRELARTENNLPVLLLSPVWDLVVLDESHAARRRKQEEGEFNSATLLLELLRQLQYQKKAKSFILLSATPMQTHPWEPWDLLSVLGAGGPWLAEFPHVRNYYQAVKEISGNTCLPQTARNAARLIALDATYPLKHELSATEDDATAIANRLRVIMPGQRKEWADKLRKASPLSRHMHRNTRNTLRLYYESGQLSVPPPKRIVQDMEYAYQDMQERAVYDSIQIYIEKRFAELEREKPGKGFVMTIYRRRASSSPFALQQSLSRRKETLSRYVEKKAYDLNLQASDQPEYVIEDDLPDVDLENKISSSLPADPQAARQEIIEVEKILDQLKHLGGKDTKRDLFSDILRQLNDEGRTILIFTEYMDTLTYLRDYLVEYYGAQIGCYSGAGGQKWVDGKWGSTNKDTITRSLHAGELRILLCTDAASEGLNLQAADALINYDLPWNPSRVEQRIGRIDRIGQKMQTVRVINLFLQESIDDKVYKALRERCGLFEHFVGAMQPVLARARKMLLGQEPISIEALHQEVKTAEQDQLAQEAYWEKMADWANHESSAYTIHELAAMFKRLVSGDGLKIKWTKPGEIVKISAKSFPSDSFSISSHVIEEDKSITPLSPLNPVISKLADHFQRSGELLPLVTVTQCKDTFKYSKSFWIGKESSIEITSLKQLVELIAAWDGSFVEPTKWLAVHSQLDQELKNKLEEFELQTYQRIDFGLKQQREAARLRLLNELGRFLVCYSAGMTDLNKTMSGIMARDLNSRDRLKRAMDRLGGYPEWPEIILDDLTDFISDIAENHRQARILGRELEAALGDPRWGC